MLAVIVQLGNRVTDIVECLVTAVLVHALGDFRRPTPGQLLERADIQVAVVEERFQLRHLASEKSPILAN